MLKKTATAAAIAAAGLLALSPLAFADDVDQERHQHSFKGNGIGEGNQPAHGNSENPDTVICNVNIQGLGQPNQSVHPADPCENVGESVAQDTEQGAKNDDDRGGSYDKRDFDPH